MLWFSMIWYDMIWYGIIWYGIVRFWFYFSQILLVLLNSASGLCPQEIVLIKRWLFQPQLKCLIFFEGLLSQESFSPFQTWMFVQADKIIIDWVVYETFTTHSLKIVKSKITGWGFASWPTDSHHCTIPSLYLERDNSLVPVLIRSLILFMWVPAWWPNCLPKAPNTKT